MVVFLSVQWGSGREVGKVCNRMAVWGVTLSLSAVWLWTQGRACEGEFAAWGTV